VSRLASRPGRSVPAPAAVSQPARPTADQPSLQKVLKYGRAEGELGMIHEKEHAGWPGVVCCRQGWRHPGCDVVTNASWFIPATASMFRSISLPGIGSGFTPTSRAGSMCMTRSPRASNMRQRHTAEARSA